MKRLNCQLTLSFGSWLKSPCGGQLRAANQHVTQVITIFEAVDKNKDTISALWSQQLLRKFVTVDIADKAPNTIKSYLNSLKHFYKYLLSEEANRLTVECVQSITSMKDRVSNWIRSYQPATAARSNERKEA